MLDAGGAIGISALKSWLAVGSAIFLIGFYLLAYLLPQYVLGRMLRTGVVILGIGLGAIMGSAFFVYMPSSERGSERQSLEVQAEQLDAQALAPGSALACLDALAGEAVETACEKELFTSPASVAAATSFVAHRLELLAAVLAYDKRGAADLVDLLRPLRRSLEADRFGFLAHVLALRDGCTSENCKALALLDDPGRVRANLSAQTFDHHIEHHVDIWAKAPDGAVVDAAQPGGQLSHKIVNIDFPTTASIPPVSIMNPEPTGPVLPGVAAAAATNPNPRASGPGVRRARKTAASAPSPQTLAQPATANAGPTEPIWPEPMPPQPAATATATNGPVQQPSGNSTVRAQ
jgi:hypothetical protein